MHSPRLIHLLALAVCLLCSAQASWLSFNRKAPVVVRQLMNPLSSPSGAAGSNSDNDNTPTRPSVPAATSAPSPPSSSSPSSTPAPQRTTSEEPSSSPESTTPSPSPTPSSSSRREPQQPVSTSSETPTQPASPQSTTPTQAAPSSSSSSESESQSPPSQTESSITQSSSTTESGKGGAAKSSATPVIITSVFVVTQTNSDGSRNLMTSTSLTTSTPALNSNESSETSGMSSHTRKTVIGVVVGVGGAIVLGALGLVAWRVWGRKKQSDENDGLMSYNIGPSGVEKSEPGSSSGPQQSPFQATLENYHQPSHVNASSNF